LDIIEDTIAHSGRGVFDQAALALLSFSLAFSPDQEDRVEELTVEGR